MIGKVWRETGGQSVRINCDNVQSSVLMILVFPTEGSGVQGHSEPQGTFDASPDHRRLSQIQTPTTNKNMKILAGTSDSQQNK